MGRRRHRRRTVEFAVYGRVDTSSSIERQMTQFEEIISNHLFKHIAKSNGGKVCGPEVKKKKERNENESI